MYFSKSHEWIEFKGSVGTVGITEYAKNELGEIVHIEFPKVGQKLKAGQEICVLESTKAAADVYTPISGVVVAVNDPLKSSTDLINKSPQSSGWLVQIKPTDLAEVNHLLSKEEYQKLISE